MKKILLIIFLIGFDSFAQDLTCKDFKEGAFVVPADSITKISYEIIRKGNTQKEIVSDPEFKQVSFGKIKWITDCSYKTNYDTTKMKLTKYQEFINKNGGVLVEMIKIKGKCFYFKSMLKIGDKTERIDGKLCKKEH